MTKIELVEERAGGEEKCFRAVAAHHQAMGRTAGEAVDALTAQISPEETDTLIIVRGLRRSILHRRSTTTSRGPHGAVAIRAESGKSLSTEEQAELENLIDAEVFAASQRAAALLGELGS